MIWYQNQAAKLEKADRVNTFYVFEQWATNPKNRDKPFLLVPPSSVEKGVKTEWTYAEAYEVVLKYARWLHEVHGVQKNEVVAMDFTNKPQFVWIWFALWSLGAKPAFINSNLRSNAFIHCVRISTARLLIVDPQIAAEVLVEEAKVAFTASESGRVIESHVLDTATDHAILSSESYRAPDSARAGEKTNSAAILIYTSGTTGLPKAANVSWVKPMAGYLFFCHLLDLKPEDRYFSALPLYHTSGSVLGVLQALGPGCAFVVCPKFSPRTFMRHVSEARATALQYIGEMCRYLVNSPPTEWDKKHALKLAFGNGMRPDVWQRFKDRFNIPAILEFYGATEGPGASMVYERNGFYRGAIGRSGWIARTLFGGNSVLVKHDHNTDLPFRDPKTGFCIKCKKNEVGELLAQLDPEKIDDKFQGYVGNEKATNSKILRDVFKKDDAYYRTGDLQRLDDNGRWWFVDRIGDTFRWKSENVSTAEVSEALGSHPVIKEANVYGVELPNHDGRAGCAAIGLVSSDDRLDPAILRELAQHARKRLPRYAVPLFLRLLKREAETTGTFKHQKVSLRNEGVDPEKMGPDELYWLQPGSEVYEPFGKSEWERILGGSAKL
jgi:acyl-CoA synthetase (AMP-forming)/AMP-acid ligase II